MGAGRARERQKRKKLKKTKKIEKKKLSQGVSFAALAAVSGAVPSEVAKGFFVPSLPRGELATAVAIVGATVMPHNLYLHSALVSGQRAR